VKYLILAVALLSIGVGLAQFEPEREPYFPVVRLRTTDGFFITAIQDRTLGPNACVKANERFLRPIRHGCLGCVVESVDCPHDLNGVERALTRGEPIPIFSIFSTGLRLAVVGPPDSAPKVCLEIASQLVMIGIKNAACVFPGKTR
jgi:hypothetical protein